MYLRTEDSTVARMKPCGIRGMRATWVVVHCSRVSFLNTVYPKIYKKQGGWVAEDREHPWAVDVPGLYNPGR